MHAHPLLPEPEMAQDALDDILLVDDAKRCAFAGSGEATPVGLSFGQAISLRSIPVSTSNTAADRSGNHVEDPRTRKQPVGHQRVQAGWKSRYLPKV